MRQSPPQLMRQVLFRTPIAGLRRMFSPWCSPLHRLPQVAFPWRLSAHAFSNWCMIVHLLSPSRLRIPSGKRCQLSSWQGHSISDLEVTMGPMPGQWRLQLAQGHSKQETGAKASPGSSPTAHLRNSWQAFSDLIPIFGGQTTSLSPVPVLKC